ncbi:hypothetical protein F5Y17DRAFT_472883 [Xylariaceae sp. FL0594]|nr:hypothetical protein F5Y17DRAFT_472883 [Xylariaceae sp. FL0594]
MQKAYDPAGNKSVYDMLETEAMWRTLWNRPPFLFHPKLFRKRQGEEAFEVIPHDGLSAQHHLIRWDGSQPLAERVCDMFGTYKSPDGKQTRYYIWNDPNIIRVHYRHDAPGRPATYEDLRRIKISPCRARVEGQVGDKFTMTQSDPTEDSEKIIYTLIAVVRCARGGEGPDSVQLYDTVGSRVRIPLRMKAIAGTQWTLGNAADHNRAYMLYYTPGFEVEVESYGHREEHEESMLRLLRASVLSSPDPTNTALFPHPTHYPSEAMSDNKGNEESAADQAPDKQMVELGFEDFVKVKGDGGTHLFSESPLLPRRQGAPNLVKLPETAFLHESLDATAMLSKDGDVSAMLRNNCASALREVL